jgi:hypothetical protein
LSFILLIRVYCNNSFLDVVLVDFSHHCDKIPDINNLREEGFVLPMVSEDSVYHGKENRMEQNSSHVVDRKQRAGKRLGTRHILQNPPPPTSSKYVRPPEVSRTSPNSTSSWGPSVQHLRLKETFHIQT